jgi:hypothetical protein
MSEVEVSYRVLRADRGAEAWWLAARRAGDAPPPLLGLLHGRSRVEVSNEEADAILAWAERVDGWADANPKPLFVHRG